MNLKLSYLFISLAIGSTFAAVKEVTLNIVNTQLAPDGFMRSTVTANGTFPGPVITAQKGDVLRVLVNNQLTDGTMRLSTSVHFEGVFARSVNEYTNEGSPGVTTCPIGPQASYTYEIPLDANQAGSFWYNSQLSLQYVDGLRGPFIIYDPKDPLKHLYDVDDESTIWTTADWWHSSSVNLFQSYTDTQIIPIASSGLFNGAGRFNQGPETAYHVTNVKQGTRYRFRIINMSARHHFLISVDNHNMTIIETDGTPTRPLIVNQIDILAGQRYSVVVSADKPVDNYWINAIITGGFADRNTELNAGFGRGILRYAGAPQTEPTTPMTQGPPAASLNALHEELLRPLNPIAPPTPDFNFTFQFDMVANASSPSGFDPRWAINHISYLAPTTPTLLKILNGANSAADFNVTENTFIIPQNKVVQVELPPNGEAGIHPFHLHSNNFWVLKSNTSDTVNTVDPIRRDTIGAGSGGTLIRFRTDKAGISFFHCHIMWHFKSGLASVFISAPDQIRRQIQPTTAWKALCPAYDSLDPSKQ